MQVPAWGTRLIHLLHPRHLPRPRWSALALVLPLVIAVALDHRTSALPEAPPERQGVAYLIPYGDVPQIEIQRARWALAEGAQRPVVVLHRRPVPRQARRSDGQVEAHVLLDELLLLAPHDAYRMMGVTERPLAAGDDTVIGYARQSERALIYSTDRLLKYATEAARRRRVRRIVVHELGHTHGAGHCELDCVMHSTTTAADIDLLPDHFCPEHRKLAVAALDRSLDHPETVVGVAQEHLRLGHWHRAAKGFRAAINHRPHDPKLRTSLGVALMARGELTNAEETLTEAARLAPKAPQPYYALAVLYAAGHAPGRAPAFLEAAVHRDRDPKRAHRAAGILYQDLMANDAQAVRHFEAHVLKGGRDPGVIARLVYLVSPAMITFTDPDVVIAQWLPGSGLQIARAAR